MLYGDCIETGAVCGSIFGGVGAMPVREGVFVPVHLGAPEIPNDKWFPGISWLRFSIIRFLWNLRSAQRRVAIVLQFGDVPP